MSTAHLLSRVSVTQNGIHDRAVVFNRGANAGFLVLLSGDGEKLTKLVDAIAIAQTAIAVHREAEASYVRHRDDPVPRAVPEHIVDARERTAIVQSLAFDALHAVLAEIT